MKKKKQKKKKIDCMEDNKEQPVVEGGEEKISKRFASKNTFLISPFDLFSFLSSELKRRKKAEEKEKKKKEAEEKKKQQQEQQPKKEKQKKFQDEDPLDPNVTIITIKKKKEILDNYKNFPFQISKKI